MQAALVAYLKTVSAVTTLVGSSPSRIRPFERFQGEALPALTYFLVDSQVDAAWSGTFDLTRSRVQVDCWGGNEDDSISLLSAVRGATDGFRGTFASTPIRGCRIAEIRSGFERSSDANTKWFRQSLDWIVWHE